MASEHAKIPKVRPKAGLREKMIGVESGVVEETSVKQSSFCCSPKEVSRYASPDPTFEEARLGFALSIASYIGPDRPEAVEKSLFDPATELPIPPEEQKEGLGSVLEKTFGLTLDRHINVESSNTQGFIAHSKSRVVLAYRGTLELVDWLTNANMITTVYEPTVDVDHAGCCAWCQGRCSGRQPRAHTGHYNAFLSTKADLDKHLLPLLREPKEPVELIVCGHSLGGGLALLALGYLLRRLEDVLSAGRISILFVTIGSPRIGDSAFVEDFKQRMSPLLQDGLAKCGRFVNDCDAIPLTGPTFMFKHAMKVHLMTELGEIWKLEEEDLDEDDPENKAILDRSDDSVKEYGTDHKVDAYAALLFQCEKKAKEIGSILS